MDTIETPHGKTQSDPRVRAAIGHWAPRFVANGVSLTDFQEVTAGITRWEEWCAAWCARAAMHEALAREALAAGFRLSAGEHFNRAGVCYHFAKFLFVNDYGEMRAAHMKAVECRAQSLPLIDPPGERVEIPYSGTRLAGILRKPGKRFACAQSAQLRKMRGPTAGNCLLWASRAISRARFSS